MNYIWLAQTRVAVWKTKLGEKKCMREANEPSWSSSVRCQEARQIDNHKLPGGEIGQLMANFEAPHGASFILASWALLMELASLNLQHNSARPSETNNKSVHIVGQKQCKSCFCLTHNAVVMWRRKGNKDWVIKRLRHNAKQAKREQFEWNAIKVSSLLPSSGLPNKPYRARISVFSSRAWS